MMIVFRATDFEGASSAEGVMRAIFSTSRVQVGARQAALKVRGSEFLRLSNYATSLAMGELCFPSSYRAGSHLATAL
jgi:hypothetical protein